MSWYRTGTASFTNGSTAVTGSGTAWIASLAVGEAILGPDGRIYEIASIASDTSLTLGSAYLGSTAATQPYAVAPTQSYLRDLAAAAASLVSTYSASLATVVAGRFGDGVAATPGITFSADQDTGFLRPGTNILAMATAGVERLRVDSAGKLGVNIAAPLARAHVYESGTFPALQITNVGSGHSLLVEDSTNPDATPFLIDNLGNVVLGHTSALTTAGFVGPLQAHVANPFTGIRWNSSNAAGPTFALGRSRSGTVGTNTIVQNGDTVASMNFLGDDGTQFLPAAAITVSVDATPGANDMPGRLSVWTTPDGAASAVERLRVDRVGNVVAMSASGGIGYGTGAGGMVTQLTNKGTGVTLNKPCGQIITSNSALAAGVAQSFLVSNSLVASTDTIRINVQSGVATGGSYAIVVDSVTSGQFRVNIRNVTGGSLSEALTLNFALFRSVAA